MGEKPIVSSEEVIAAKEILDRMSTLATREQPIPLSLVRIMLEEAAKVRLGMKPTPETPL